MAGASPKSRPQRTAAGSAVLTLALTVALLCTLASTTGCSRPATLVDSEGPVVRLLTLEPDVLLNPQNVVDNPDKYEAPIPGEVYKVGLDHDFRNAVWTKRPLRRRLNVAVGSRLSFAIGVGGQPTAPVTFRASWQTSDDSSNPPDADPVVLFESTIAPEQANTWTEYNLDLDGISGAGELELQLAGPRNQSQAWGFWAHPRMTRQRAKDAPPSLILISVDTLRADHLSLYGYDRPTSPRLDAWATKHATVFENTVAASPWTLPSHRSLFTGLDAIRHGANYDTRNLGNSLADKVDAGLLTERLRDAGYLTAAHTGGVYLHPNYGFAKGFDAYSSWPRPQGLYEELETILDRGRDFLDLHHDQPFFLFLHTYELHDPYRCDADGRWSELTDRPKPRNGTRIAIKTHNHEEATGFRKLSHFMERFNRKQVPLEDAALATACYDAGIARLDNLLGSFLEDLDAHDAGRHTVVVLTSDHGEALGEKPRVGHTTLYDDVVMVPLVISEPGGRGAGRRVERQVRTIDIMPTVLELLGQASEPAIDGVSLAPFLDGQKVEVDPVAWTYAAQSSWGLGLRYANRLKFVLPNSAWPGAQPPGSLFDLRADPGETNDLWHSSPQTPKLVDKVDDDYRERAVGLRLEVHNPGDQHFEGVISGHMVNALGVKTTNMDCKCLDFVKVGRAELTIPPRTHFTLNFEQIYGKRLLFQGALQGSDRPMPGTMVSIGELERPASFSWDGSGWQPVSRPLKKSEVGISVYWQGSGPITEMPVEHDPELRRQLESLGYIQ